MSKIVMAANSMVANQDKISNVIQNENVFYFLYDNKYKWSIHYYESDNDYRLIFFATDKTLVEIAEMNENQWERFNNLVVYSSKELKTKEAFDTFQELYVSVKEKLFGLNKALDEIIKDLGKKDDLPF